MCQSFPFIEVIPQRKGSTVVSEAAGRMTEVLCNIPWSGKEGQQSIWGSRFWGKGQRAWVLGANHFLVSQQGTVTEFGERGRTCVLIDHVGFPASIME